VPKLYSSQQIVKTLEREGFVFVSQRGSHAKYRKIGSSISTVIIPAGRSRFRAAPSARSCVSRVWMRAPLGRAENL
jgi:predicted RNA binding protein YcfA (HicA-like mRNA interferase family)